MGKLTFVGLAADLVAEREETKKSAERVEETRRYWQRAVAKSQEGVEKARRDLEAARRKAEAYEKELTEWEASTAHIRQFIDELTEASKNGRRLTREERQELLTMFDILSLYPRPRP